MAKPARRHISWRRHGITEGSGIPKIGGSIPRHNSNSDRGLVSNLLVNFVPR